MADLSYAASGVNRQLADQFVDKIAFLSKKTLNSRVKSAVGGYASLYELDRNRWLAASTDGVGTKLKLAFQLGDHRTIGIDLVAMSVNDLLCVGAEPLFFLDYFATGKLLPKVGVQVLEGIVEGCRQAGCALVGGETAEMPDFYAPGEYDLGGFAVGSVHPKQVLPKKEIRAGDQLIGLASSGCHSNGYSWLRKNIPKGPHGKVIARELLTPTRIYVKALRPLLSSNQLKGMAHITGSGYLNVPRMSEKVSYQIQLPPAQERPRIFQWISSLNKMSFAEQAQTFNMGIGMVLAVAPDQVKDVLRKLKRSGEQAWHIGEVIRRKGSQSEVVLSDGTQSVKLVY